MCARPARPAPRAPWTHNAHYHDTLLAHVPPGCSRALDVGCGDGDFARRLARVAAHVDAVDRSDAMIATARERSRGVDNVHFLAADVLAHPWETGAYDFVSCIACLHHLPFEPALTLARALLRPGGVLAVVGLFRSRGFADFAASAVAMPLSLARRALDRALHSRAWPASGAPMPMVEPTMTLAEVREGAARVLPGAKVRRHLYWRYSLVYRGP